ncbi:MAG TPA: L,D-transpeptidase [Pyrinomonadaceae bacterium]|nr:L,D-transpeptidase [Pyrinomonadaceae bacterium]
MTLARSHILTFFFAAFVALTYSCGEVAAPTHAKSLAGFTARPNADEFSVNKIPLKLPLTNPKIVVWKSRRRLMLYDNNKLVRVYRVGLGTDPVNDKVKEGDRRTPEGEFYIFTKNEHSQFYLSLGISYPNIADAERGLRDGLITRAQHDQIVDAIRRRVTPPQHTSLGGEIYIHGNGSQSDWTWGCVALDNENMRELFDAVPVKTPVVIHH